MRAWEPAALRASVEQVMNPANFNHRVADCQFFID
jgi:hypothetical protein